MSIISGIKDWLNRCPDISVVDIGQTAIDSAGLYKQATQTVEELIDGSQVVTANYYILLLRDTQLSSEREDSEALLEKVEDWIYMQGMSGDLPVLPQGKAAQSVGMSNGYYMSDTDDNKSVYQVTLQLQYIKECTTHD